MDERLSPELDRRPSSAQYGDVLFIGGDFQRVGESVSPGPNAGPYVDGYTGLAAIDMATGQAIESFKPQLTANANQTLKVLALSVVGDRLFVGGQFATVDGQDRYNLAAIDINPVTMRGTLVGDFDPVVGIPGNANEASFDVKTILAGTDGLYIGGGFGKIDGKGRPKTAKLNWDGTLNTAYKTAGVNGSVNDMAWSIDQQSIFLAGHFTQIGVGNTRVAIGRIDPTTGATLPWAVPLSQIPGATSSGQICYELAVSATRVFAGCGKTPNFVGAFRLDNRDEGTRTWQYATGGNVQTVSLLPNGQDLVIGGHLGINNSSTYNGLMKVCGKEYLRAIGILRNVHSTTNWVSPITNGSTSTSEPYLDCSLLPNIDGVAPNGPNFAGVNRYGGLWEIQVTNDHLWALGEFRYVNALVRRSIARFAWTGVPTPPPPPVQPVLTELVTPSPLMVQPDRTVTFTIRCPDQADPCNGTVKLVAGGGPQLGPQAVTMTPLEEASYTAALDDTAWDKLVAKPNGTIGGSVQLTAEGSPGTSVLSSSISVQLKLETPPAA
ncbi:hypothetical protein BH18ACT17_BH18ACT17_06420 [soil metagenome]